MKKIIISMGDPAGIGPEIIVKFFDELYKKNENSNVFYAVSGSQNILKHYINLLNLDLKLNIITKENLFNNSYFEKNSIALFDVDTKGMDINIGKISKDAGELTMRYLNHAVDLVEEGVFNALVTAPISKDSINKAGYKYSGHTSFLADRFNTKDFAMILKGIKLQFF